MIGAAAMMTAATAARQTGQRQWWRLAVRGGGIWGHRQPSLLASSSHLHRRSMATVGLAAAISTSTWTGSNSNNATGMSTQCAPPQEVEEEDADVAKSEKFFAKEVDPDENACFPASLLEHDHYNGVTIHLDRLEDNLDGALTLNDFAQALKTSLQTWYRQGKRGVWIYCPASQADKVAAATELGFDFHMVQQPPSSSSEDAADAATDASTAKRPTLILSKWLPADLGLRTDEEPSSTTGTQDDSVSRLPLGPTTQVGVGCLVFHPSDPSLMLTVREKTGPAAASGLWKMPTGLADAQEDIHIAAVRELWEETGLDSRFRGILVFRQAHQSRAGTRSSSDLFFVCLMELKEEAASPEEQRGSTDAAVPAFKPCLYEIADIQWMNVQEYCDQATWQNSPVYQELNNAILRASQHALFHNETLPLGFGGSNATNTLYMSAPQSHL